MLSKHTSARLNRDLFLEILRLIAIPDFLHKNRLPSSFHRGNDKLRYMEGKGYIIDAGNCYKITSRGKKLLAEDDLWNLKIPIPTKWDTKWHVVLFDIPTDKRKRRDIFRLRLKELGLVLYQNSVWVYPYPLEDVVSKISSFYMLTNCVSFITADSLTGEEKLRKYFKL